MAQKQLNPKELKELINLLQKVDGLTQQAAENQARYANATGNAEAQLKRLKETYEELTSDIDYAIIGLQKTVQEITNQNIGLKESLKAYDGLTTIAEKIQRYQKGYSDLSSKELQKLKTQSKLEKQKIENAQHLLKERKAEIEANKTINEAAIDVLLLKQNLTASEEKQLKNLEKAQEKITAEITKTNTVLTQNKAILSNNDELYKGINLTLDETIRKAKNIEKALGLSGAAIDGIGKAFNKLGLGALADQMGIEDAKEKMREMADQITNGGENSAGLIGKFKVLGAGIASLGKSIIKNLNDPLVQAAIAAKAVSAGIKGIKKGFSLLSGGIGSAVGFVKSLFGMADQFAGIFEKYAKAGQFASQNFSAVGSQVSAITANLNAVARADPFMRVAEAGPAMKTLVDGTGIIQSQMAGSVKEANDLSYWLGYSAEETGQLYKLGQLNNKSAKEVVANVRAQGLLLNRQYKTSLDLRKVEQIAAKASATVKFNLSQNPKALADAAFHAAKLGMSLDEIASASEQTLNFEQSIQDQLAYQAMSGKEINIDAYQQAALRGDTVTAARELNALISQHGPGLKNNVLLQEQFSKAIGVSRDQVLQGMTVTSLANKMGEDKVNIEKGLQFYMKQGLTQEEAANKLAKEGLSTQLAQSKKAEAMSRALEDFRDYMATKLYPLFKAVFSPTNIKMFMAAINGMRPVFTELGKAITAFFSPKSAGAMTDVIKNDIMPAILSMAKMLTEVAGVAGEALFNVIKTLGPVIKKDVIPIFKYLGSIIKELAPVVGKLVQSFAQGLGKVFSKINEHKEDIKEFIEILAKGLTNTFSFVANNLKEIALTLVAFKALTSIRSLKSTIMGAPGSSSMNPMYTRNVGMPGGAGGGGAAAAGGGIMSKIKGFFRIGGAAAAGGAAAPLTTTAAPTSFADKRKMVAARQAAGQGLGSKKSTAALPPPVTPPPTAGVAGASKFGNLAGGMLKGAAAILVLSAALYVAAKAFQEFSKVEWDGVGKGTAALVVLTGAALGLGKIKKDIMEGAGAIAILGASLYIAAKAFQEFSEVTWSGVSTGLVALTGLTISAIFLGKAKKDIIQGAGAIAILGASLYIAAKGIQEFMNVGWEEMGKAGVALIALGGSIVVLSKFLGPASGDLIKGAGAIAILGASLYIAAKGIQAFMVVELGEMGKAGIALVALGGSIVALSKLLKPASGDLVKAGVAMIPMAAALYVIAKASKEFADVKPEDMDKAGLALTGLTIAAIFLGKAGPMVLTGAAAMLVMSAALYVTAKAVQEFKNVKPEDMGKAGLALIALTGATLGLGATMASGVGAVAILLGVGAMIAMGGALYVVAEGIKALQGAVGGGKLDTLGADLGKGLTAITVGLKDIDFDNLIDTFDKLEDAFDELDIDELLAFSQLASVDLGKASTNLIEGIMKLTNIELPINVDFKTFTTDLQEKLKPITSINAAFKMAINQLNIDDLIQLGQVSGDGIKNALGGVMDAIKSMTTMDFGKLDLSEIEDKISTLEDIFDVLEDAISELNFEQLKAFSDSVNTDLGAATKALVNGINQMAAIKEPTEIIGENISSAFRQFNRLISGLDVKAFTAFAALAKEDIGLAMSKFLSSLSTLANVDFSVMTKNADAIKTAFKQFNEVISQLEIEPGPVGTGSDGILAFAKLADVNLSSAAQNVQLGIEKMNEAFKSELTYDFSHIKAAFEQLNSVIKDVDLEAFKKLGELATVEIGDGATKIKAGLDSIKKEFGGLDITQFEYLTTNVQPIFDKIATVFGKDSKASQSIATLEAFGKADFTKLASSVTGLKEGLAKMSEQFLAINLNDFVETGMVAQLFIAINKLFSEGLNIDNLIKFGEADFTKFQSSVVGLKKGLVELKGVATAFTTVIKSEGVPDVEKIDTFDGIKDLIDNAAAAFSGQNVNALIEFAKNDFSKLPDSILGLKTVLERAGELPTGKNANFEALKTDITALMLAFYAIDINKAKEIVEASNAFATLKTALSNFVDASKAVEGLVISDTLLINITNFSDGIKALDIEKLKSLNDIDTSKLQTNFTNVKNSIGQFKDMTNITPTIKLISVFHKVLDIFFKTDYSKSTVVSTIQELTKIDTTKLDTLKKSIDALSTSFKGFGETISGMGDLSPVITISTKMLELHQSLTKNPINEKAVQQLTEGVKAIFSSLMLGVVDFLVKNPNAVNMDKAFGGDGGMKTPQAKDGVVQVQDAVGLNSNGGPVVSTFQQGELTPVMQGIKEDNVYLTTNKLQSNPTRGTTVDNSAVIAAINRLTDIMVSSTDKKIIVDIKSDIPTFVSKVRQTSIGIG